MPETSSCAPVERALEIVHAQSLLEDRRRFETLMEPGPSTVRPDTVASELVDRLARRQLNPRS